MKHHVINHKRKYHSHYANGLRERRNMAAAAVRHFTLSDDLTAALGRPATVSVSGDGAVSPDRLFG
jgi:hypothetical protein